MNVLESALPFRKKASFFIPVMLLVLVGAMQFAPFASFDDKTLVSDDNGEYLTEERSEVSFYAHLVNVEEYDRDLSERYAPFGGTTTESLTYDEYSFIDDIEDVAEDVGNRLSTITTVVLLLTIVGFTSRGRELDVHPNITRRSISGATMAVLAVLFFLLAKDIQTGYGESIETTLEPFYDDPDEGATSINEGAWGEIVIEQSESTVFTVEWGPSWLYWFALLGMLVAAVGGFAGLSTLSSKFDTEERSVWADDTLPEWVAAERTHVWLGAIAFAVVLAMVAPWYSVDQTWVKNENVGEDYTNSTHEIGWTMSPFYVHFSNDTGLYLTEEGQVEGDLSGYSERFELGNMAPVLLELQWPLIMTGVLLGAWGIARWVPEAQKRLELDKTQLGLMFTAALVFVMTFSATADFEKSMTRSAEDDLLSMSPLLNDTFVHLGTEDLFAGESFNQDISIEGNRYTATYAQMEWGPSWGFWATSILPWLCLGLICSLGVPRAMDRLHKEETEMLLFTREHWGAKPVVAALVGVLLISGLGSFPPSALGDGASSAPQALYQWDLSYQRTYDTTEGSGSLDDGQTMGFTFDIGTEQLGNTTSFEYFLVCFEGETALLSDSEDSVQFTVSPPEGVNTGDMVLSGSLTCDGMGYYDSSYADFYLPRDEYAPTNKSFVGMIEFPNLHNGVWTLAMTAEVQGGDAFSTDGSLDFQFEMYGSGYTDFSAEKRED